MVERSSGNDGSELKAKSSHDPIDWLNLPEKHVKIKEGQGAWSAARPHYGKNVPLDAIYAANDIWPTLNKEKKYDPPIFRIGQDLTLPAGIDIAKRREDFRRHFHPELGKGKPGTGTGKGPDTQPESSKGKPEDNKVMALQLMKQINNSREMLDKATGSAGRQVWDWCNNHLGTSHKDGGIAGWWAERFFDKERGSDHLRAEIEGKEKLAKDILSGTFKGTVDSKSLCNNINELFDHTQEFKAGQTAGSETVTQLVTYGVEGLAYHFAGKKVAAIKNIWQRGSIALAGLGLVGGATKVALKASERDGWQSLPTASEAWQDFQTGAASGVEFLTAAKLSKVAGSFIRGKSFKQSVGRWALSGAVGGSTFNSTEAVNMTRANASNQGRDATFSEQYDAFMRGGAEGAVIGGVLGGGIEAGTLTVRSIKARLATPAPGAAPVEIVPAQANAAAPAEVAVPEVNAAPAEVAVPEVNAAPEAVQQTRPLSRVERLCKLTGRQMPVGVEAVPEVVAEPVESPALPKTVQEQAAEFVADGRSADALEFVNKRIRTLEQIGAPYEMAEAQVLKAEKASLGLDRLETVVADLEALGSTGQIESLCAEGKPAAKIAESLQSNHPELLGVDLRELQQAVRVYRNNHQIPASNAGASFEAWKQAWQEKVAQLQTATVEPVVETVAAEATVEPQTTTVPTMEPVTVEVPAIVEPATVEVTATSTAAESAKTASKKAPKTKTAKTKVASKAANPEEPVTSKSKTVAEKPAEKAVVEKKAEAKARAKKEADAAAKKLAEEAEAKRPAEEKRVFEEAEAKRLAEEKRVFEEAEAKRLAEEKRVFEEAETKRLAEEKRVFEEAEAKRLAEEKRVFEEAEAKRLAEEKRVFEEAEVKRLAEEKQVFEEAEAKRLAEEKRVFEEAEAKRLAEEKRVFEEAEVKRLADEPARLAEAEKFRVVVEFEPGFSTQVRDSIAAKCKTVIGEDVEFVGNSNKGRTKTWEVKSLEEANEITARLEQEGALVGKGGRSAKVRVESFDKETSSFAPVVDEQVKVTETKEPAVIDEAKGAEESRLTDEEVKKQTEAAEVRKAAEEKRLAEEERIATKKRNAEERAQARAVKKEEEAQLATKHPKNSSLIKSSKKLKLVTPTEATKPNEKGTAQTVTVRERRPGEFVEQTKLGAAKPVAPEQPIAVDEPKPVVAEEPKPVVAEEPKPVVAEEPKQQITAEPEQNKVEGAKAALDAEAKKALRAQRKEQEALEKAERIAKAQKKQAEAELKKQAEAELKKQAEAEAKVAEEKRLAEEAEARQKTEAEAKVAEEKRIAEEAEAKKQAEANKVGDAAGLNAAESYEQLYDKLQKVLERSDELPDALNDKINKINQEASNVDTDMPSTIDEWVKDSKITIDEAAKKLGIDVEEVVTTPPTGQVQEAQQHRVEAVEAKIEAETEAVQKPKKAVWKIDLQAYSVGEVKDIMKWLQKNKVANGDKMQHMGDTVTIRCFSQAEFDRVHEKLTNQKNSGHCYKSVKTSAPELPETPKQ